MSNFVPLDTVKGLIPGALLQNDANEAWREEPVWTNNAALATTTGQAETPIFIARHKMRVIGCRFSPGAAITGAATNNTAIVIAIRHTAAPATQKIIITYTADATPAKDIVAFGFRDLLVNDVNGSAADADFILLPGDIVTLTIVKNGTGMTFPLGSVDVILEMRD
jgi:hypothetical protein